MATKYVLGARSLKRLEGVHPKLVAVVKTAISLPECPFDFTVLEGLRSKKRQEQLVASGASTTMNSRHLTGHAVDLAPVVGGVVRWDWPLYDQLGPYIKGVAGRLWTPIEWGGDWRSFRDGPHFQLPWKEFPA